MNESQWISVKERMPEFPCVILDALHNNPYVPLGIVTIKDIKHGDWAVDSKHIRKLFKPFGADNPVPYGSRIIYWLPIPEPPEK